MIIDPSFRREAENLLELLKKKDGLRDARVIKSNMVRTVFEIRPGGIPVILKRYHSTGFLNALKYLFRPTRARTEWRVMRRLNDLNIPTAGAIACGEKRQFGILTDSFFASTVIKNSSSLGQFMLSLKQQKAWNSSIREILFDKLARLTVRLHEAGVFHTDYHLGNILASGIDAPDPDIFIIDLHAVFFPRKVGKKQMVLNLARVAEAVRQLGPVEVEVFLEKYLALRPGFSASVATLKKEVMHRVAALDRRRLISRTRRCLVNSSRFRLVKAGGYRMNLRRTFEPDQVLEAIRIHDTVLRDGDSRLIPPSNKNKVTVVEVPAPADPVRLCVKEYRRRSFLRRLLPLPAYAKHSWVAGLGLEVRGIATPETVAWARGRGRELVITRFVGKTLKLHAYAMERRDALPPGEGSLAMRDLVADLARFVRRIHDSGIRHRDLCEQNILVREVGGLPVLYLLDLDTVTFAHRLTQGRIVKNLVQLGHLPGDVDVLLKARFLKYYLGGRRRGEHRELFIRVNEGVIRRMAAKRERFRKMGGDDPHPFPSALKKEWP